MKNYEDIKKMITEHKGMITIENFKQRNISNYYINMLIKDKIIERVDVGLYNKCDEFEDEFFIMQYKSKRIVFSFNTALYFINETEVVPAQIDITVPNGYNVHRLNKNIRFHYTPEEYLYLGVITTVTPYGNRVFSYNLERCICDIVRTNNNGIDREQHINKIIRNAFLNNKIDYNILLDYAKKLKCDKKIMNYVEVLI